MKVEPAVPTWKVESAVVERLTQRAGQAVEWLGDLGVEFYDQLVFGGDETLRLRVDGKGEGTALPLARLKARVREVQGGNPQTPVVISADKNVKYETVVKVMDNLQRAGVQRVGLLVKNAGT